MTFADVSLLGYLKDNFVLLWHNQAPEGPGIEGAQQAYTPEQARAYPEGGGGGNVRSYFCTPDGKVVYYLEGYWGFERYLAEARFGRELAMRVAALPEAQRALESSKALAARREEVARWRQKLREQHPQEFSKKVYQSEVRKREAAFGLLENTLAASVNVSAQPVQPILGQLQMNHGFRGEFR
ncbi:MAG: hypothetical protein L0Z62_30015 [Gemmataceae bacterium]|nr:hypothetical protein [Gemmataceae bacterium]